MNLELVNDLFNNLKENKFVQNFINEISNYLENNLKNDSDFGGKEIPTLEIYCLKIMLQLEMKIL